MFSKKPQIELLRELLSDKKTHICIGKIKKLDLETGRSELRVELEIWPEKVGAVARLSWDQVGPDSGIFGFPAVDDLVLVAAVDGNFDALYVIKRLSNPVDKIPIQATDGSTVVKSLAGKKVKIHSDTRINLGRAASDSNAEMDEPMVLGKTFQAHQSKVLGDLSVHRHLCLPPGYYSIVPDNASEFISEKSSPIDDGSVLSDLVFTEK
jgi:hypothetical protein